MQGRVDVGHRGPAASGKDGFAAAVVVEDVRQEYASLRASVDAMHTTMRTRFQEFNVCMSSLELSQMKLAASVDNAHSKIDRLEVEIEEIKAGQDQLRSDIGK
jgi:hypothetical protein